MLKNKLLILLLSLFAVVLIAGCGAEKEEPADMAEGTTEEMGEAMEGEMETMADDFVAATEKTLAEWDTKISEAQAKVDAMPDPAKKPMEDMLNTLKTKRQECTTKLDAVKNADETTMEAARAEATTAMSDLESAYNEFAAKL